MAEVKFFKVNALPDVLEADSFYYVQNGDYAESYLTTVDGEARKVGNSEMIGELIDLAIAGKQNQLVAGTGITIDVTDPDNPVISSSGGGSAGVSSFNSRVGVVTLNFSDVTAALAYTPVTPSELSAVSGAIPTSPADIGAATAAQGDKADSAVQPVEMATAIAGTATAAQGAKADTAVQPAALSSGLATKVDIVPGKQLSTEDYTSAEKTKLSGVATGATKNSNTDELQESAAPTNRWFTTARVLATTLSGLSVATAGEVVAADSILVAIGKFQRKWNDLSDILAGLVASIGSKVDKVEGYGLSQANYTEAEKTKLAGLGSGSNYISVQSVRPSNGTASSTVLGTNVSPGGTISHPALDQSSLLSSVRRVRFTGGTSAASQIGLHETALTKTRGGAAGIGGFHVEITFGQATNFTGHQVFVGLAAATALLGSDPSQVANTIGLGYDAADDAAGNWYLIHNDASGSAAKDNSGVPRNATDLLRLTLHAEANSSSIDATVRNMSTGVTVFSTTVTTKLPAPTSFMAMRMVGRNGSLGNSQILELVSMEAGYQE